MADQPTNDTFQPRTKKVQLSNAGVKEIQKEQKINPRRSGKEGGHFSCLLTDEKFTHSVYYVEGSGLLDAIIKITKLYSSLALNLRLVRDKQVIRQ